MKIQNTNNIFIYIFQFMVELIFQKDNIGVGKRKQAVARVFLVPGEGNLIINKVSGDKYLQYNE